MAILYLLRHAQSHLCPNTPDSEFELSEQGRIQAQEIVPALVRLQPDHLYTSPFRRCLETTKPLSEKTGLEMKVENDLRERAITNGWVENFREIWQKSWEDFHFALPGCESTHECGARIQTVLKNISERHIGHTIIVSTHGAAIAIFLNQLEQSFHMEEANKIKNPDLFKIDYKDGEFSWDRSFKACETFSQHCSSYHETPIRGGNKVRL